MTPPLETVRDDRLPQLCRRARCVHRIASCRVPATLDNGRGRGELKNRIGRAESFALVSPSSRAERRQPDTGAGASAPGSLATSVADLRRAAFVDYSHHRVL